MGKVKKLLPAFALVVSSLLIPSTASATTCGTPYTKWGVYQEWSTSFSTTVTRPGVRVRRCTDGIHRWKDPLWAIGGYTRVSGKGFCYLGRFDGYRFNYGNWMGYNVPSFMVECDGSLPNIDRVSLAKVPNVFGSRQNCISIYVTQVWQFTNDKSKWAVICI